VAGIDAELEAAWVAVVFEGESERERSEEFRGRPSPW
jgi:hypothetical protein